MNKEEIKDGSELIAVDDVKQNDDDETDEIEDISAYYKNAIIKLEGEVVEFDLERNVSSSFVPIEADSLSIIDAPHANRKKRRGLDLLVKRMPREPRVKRKLCCPKSSAILAQNPVLFKAKFMN